MNIGLSHCIDNLGIYRVYDTDCTFPLFSRKAVEEYVSCGNTFDRITYSIGACGVEREVILGE